MSILKKTKDKILKILNGTEVVPRGLLELNNYFRVYRAIDFESHKEDGCIVVVSKNFHQGSIVTSGCDAVELEKNIKDAILTAFDVPSSYGEEAKIFKVGNENQEYALAQ